MSFLERAGTKGEVLRRLGMVFLAAQIASMNDGSMWVNPKDFGYASSYAPIDRSNVELKSEELKETTTAFVKQIIHFDSLQQILPDYPIEQLPKPTWRPYNLERYGIETFQFVRYLSKGEAEDLALVLRFGDNVKFGRAFQQNPDITPIWPAVIFGTEENIFSAASVSEFITIPNNRRQNPPLEHFLGSFPRQAVRYGQEFIIQFNAGVFNVRGKELPSFSLPFRFILESDSQGISFEFTEEELELFCTDPCFQ